MKPGRHYEGFRDQKKVEQGGLIRLSGAFLKDHQDEIINLVKHEGLAKIANIKHVDGTVEVETSDHNMAMHIGKKLVSAYKGNHEVKFREGEKYAEVRWNRD